MAPLDDLVKKLKALKIEHDINMLLLGETGVGKSTFINAIANYCKFRTFKRASNGKLSILLPTRFRIQDPRTKIDIEIKVGEEVDNNEMLAVGASATQNIKSYVFPIVNNSARLRLIDTPGIVDTRGIHQDHVNMEAILDYVGNLDELHAICLIFKSNQNRNTVPFIYAINEILSRLEKSAIKNLVFVFTHARGQDYSPGSTLECLQKIFSKIEGSGNRKIKIPLKDNIFCFDNEAFRYLAAVQFGKMNFPKNIKKRNIESWDRSYESFYNMIMYIIQCLEPHYVKHTEAVNTARRIIMQMAKPMAEISQLINDNIFVMERQQKKLSSECNDLAELRKNLYMPVIDIKSKELPFPMTVCTSKECCDVKKVGGLNKLHFRAPCHDHCYLEKVENKLIGDTGLTRCAIMNPSTGDCDLCTCSYRHHMHVYYNTELIETRQLDENVNKNVLTKEQMVQKQNNLIAQMQEKISKLKEEHQVIIKSTARFQHFLQTNAITTINDTYKEYIMFLLESLKYRDKDQNEHDVKQLNELLQQYEELRKLLIETTGSQPLGEGKSITAKDIEIEKENLFKLKYNGAKLKELFNAQKKAIRSEHRDTIVTTPILGSALEPDSEDKEELEKKDERLNSNIPSQLQTGSENCPDPWQFQFGGQIQNCPQYYPNQFNLGAFPPNQGKLPENQRAFPVNQWGLPPNQGGFPPNRGFAPNQGGFLNQNQYIYNQNVPCNNESFAAQSLPVNPNPNNQQQDNWNGPQGYGQNSNFNPGSNNYELNNFGPNAYGPNYNGLNNYCPNYNDPCNYEPNYNDPYNYGTNYYRPNNYEPNNCRPNNYNFNNYRQSNNSVPSTSRGQNYGNGGDYQNCGNNDNYYEGKGHEDVQKQYIKNEFDNQNQDYKKSNRNEDAKPKQQTNAEQDRNTNFRTESSSCKTQ